MKYLVAIIACFVAFSMNSQVDRILVNGSQAHANLNLLELESIIETLQAEVAALQASAFDGAYGSLTGAPTIPSNVSDLTNDAGFTTFDGDYVSLTNQPALFDGNYNTLTNKPAIPSNVSDLTNDAGFTTFDGAYSSLSDLPSMGWVDLFAANLSGAYLANANLSGASLTFTDLSGANLANANLSGVDLFAANLSGANLANANLSGASLSGVNWTGAYILNCTGCTCPNADDDNYCD